MKKNPQIGIITCILYFIAVSGFLITKSEIALTIWEIFTIIGAPIIMLVLIELASYMKIGDAFKNAMLVFMSCTCALTGVAHIVNITVTRKLIAQGVEVPNYFRIGYWPSVEMAVDYLAWGFFMGLAFLSVGLAIGHNSKQNIMMKIIVLTCAFLCLSGFCGTIFINENIWYLAPLGYGCGTIIICFKMMQLQHVKD